MITSFKDKEAERLFGGKYSGKLPPEIQRGAFRKLRMLHRAGSHSIRINDQWRICFEWEDGNASQVEIVDYHKGRRKK